MNDNKIIPGKPFMCEGKTYVQCTAKVFPIVCADIIDISKFVKEHEGDCDSVIGAIVTSNNELIIQYMDKDNKYKAVTYPLIVRASI